MVQIRFRRSHLADMTKHTFPPCLFNWHRTRILGGDVPRRTWYFPCKIPDVFHWIFCLVISGENEAFDLSFVSSWSYVFEESADDVALPEYLGRLYSSRNISISLFWLGLSSFNRYSLKSMQMVYFTRRNIYFFVVFDCDSKRTIQRYSLCNSISVSS